MLRIFQYLVIFNKIWIYINAEIPTLYEYYTEGGISDGLNDNKPYFTLNSKNITIFSGSLHYFRVPRPYWRDRLRKYRAAGLICVETYVPWNLHEYQNGMFDFGSAGSSFQDFLNIVEFLKLAKEEDLFVILRPGPFIDSEWEFGGLPSWLLRYENMKVRTSDKTFISFVERYFKNLLELLSPLQFSKGGPIIAVQIENEYGNTDDGINVVDTKYLMILKEMLKKYGIVELLFTSDTPSNGFSGTLPGILATANFDSDPIRELTLLKNFQPNKPLMVMEYWSGWYDHWTEKHHTTPVDKFERVLEKILIFGASVNFYMFHGGTSWGFMNGADLKNKSTTAIDNEGYEPDVTTYDYNAPISEPGDYTEKYFKVKQIIKKFSKINLKQPPIPKLIKRTVYSAIKIIKQLDMDEILQQSYTISNNKLVPMELLPINNNSGQSFGYIAYRVSKIDIPKDSILEIEGRICDTILVLINGKLKNKILKHQDDLNGFGFWKQKNSKLYLGPDTYEKASLELIVENWGRVNYGFLQQFNQHKGLWQGNIYLNKKIVIFNEIIPLEFKRSFLIGLKNWRNFTSTIGPKLYKAELIVDEPKDTYVDIRNWNKGIIIVNNFVLGRYVFLGPQYSVYLPAPFLKRGVNEILIFEHYKAGKSIKFVENLIFK